MALGAVVHEAGFERRFDPGHSTLVDIGLLLLAGGGFYVEVKKFLTVDDGDTQFFLLRGIDEDAFHADELLIKKRNRGCLRDSGSFYGGHSARFLASLGAASAQPPACDRVAASGNGLWSGRA